MHSTVQVEFSNHLRGFVKQEVLTKIHGCHKNNFSWILKIFSPFFTFWSVSELLLVPLGDRIQDRNHI